MNDSLRAASYRKCGSLIGSESAEVIVCNQIYEHGGEPAALLQSIHFVRKSVAMCKFVRPDLSWPIESRGLRVLVPWLSRRLAMRTVKAALCHD